MLYLLSGPARSMPEEVRSVNAIARPLVLALVVFVQIAVAQDGSPAYVVSSGNGWTMAGRALQRGSALRAGATLTAGGMDEILLECGAAGFVAYACDRPPCRIAACATSGNDVTVRRLALVPLTEPVTRGPAGHAPASAHPSTHPSLLDLARSFALALFSREPTEVVFPAARTSGHPSDAVLRLDARGLHVGPALTRVLAGRVCVQLRRLPATSSDAGRTLTFDWDRNVDPEGPAAAHNLTPGLYAMRTGTPGAAGACEFDADTRTAWALVASDAAFDRASAEWTRHAASFRAFEEAGASLRVAAAAKHAVLASLADAVERR